MVSEQIILEFGGMTRQVDLAVEILGIPASSNEWLIAADIVDDKNELTPDQVNWYYSDAVDKSFIYVPENYSGGLIRVKAIVTSEDFDRVRLSLVRVPWAKSRLDADQYPRLVRCRYAAKHVSMPLHDYTSEPIQILGEINL